MQRAMTTFHAFELRAIDVEASRDFYARLLGIAPWVTPLPARARERGAPAHWLGRLVVPSLEGALAHVRARGGSTLGPVGEKSAVCRDPGGAVFGLSFDLSSASSNATAPFAWHELHTDDVDRAFDFYAGMAPWRRGAPLDASPEVQFDGARLLAGGLGAVLETVGRVPGLHPHWLFYAAVEDLPRALELVRGEGGRVQYGPTEGPDGRTFAICEDHEGAAFGLQRC